MAWPSGVVSTTGMDADADALPRADILSLTQKVNTIIGFGISGSFAPDADNSLTNGTAAFRWGNTYSTNFRPGAGTVIWTSGAGTPEGVVTAPVGSLYTRTDGGAGTTVYVKETGAGNTGWATVLGGGASKASWTPVIAGATTAGAGTYTQQQGSYMQMGGIVQFMGRVVWTAHTGTGPLLCTLPSTPANDVPQIACTVALESIDWSLSAWTTAPVPRAVIVPATSAHARLYQQAPGAVLTVINIDVAGTLLISGQYPV